MEVHFTPEQEKKLAQIAASSGTDPEALVKDATMRLLQEDERISRTAHSDRPRPLPHTRRRFIRSRPLVRRCSPHSLSSRS